MDSTAIIILLIAAFTVLFLVVGFIGNKIVDKTSDRFRNKRVRERNASGEKKTENLADRYK